MNPVVLNAQDFNSKGELIKPSLMDKKVIILIQADYCGYCKDVKPTFEMLAKEYHKTGIVLATIKLDSDHPNEQLGNVIHKIKQDFRGIPDFIKVIKGHTITDSGPLDRTYNNLKRYILN